MSLQLTYFENITYFYPEERDPFAIFKMILGKERVEQYELNKFPMELVYKFMNGMSGRRTEEILGSLIGYEFNAYVVKVLRKMNAESIMPEVDIQTGFGCASVDCIATFNTPQKFTRILPSLKEESFYLKGKNTFENKAKRKIPTKTLHQIQSAKTMYPNTNVVVLADTLITSQICKRINDEGTNIIRSNVSKKDLINNLLKIQRQIKNVPLGPIERIKYH